MRSTITCIFLGALSALAMFAIMQAGPQATADYAQIPHQTTAESDRNLTVFTSPSGQQITLIDKRHRVMGVYHVDAKTGQIKLQSVRRFQWDLELEHYNGSNPLPEQIRTMLSPRRS